MLIDRWRPNAIRIARIVARVSGAVIPSDELESAAMWGLFYAANRFNPEKGEFGAYLYYMVRGAILDHIRFETHHGSRSKMRFYSLESKKGLRRGMMAHAAPPAADNRELVELVMRPLSSRLRKIVRLRFYEGKTYQEVGVRMRLSAERIYQLTRTALRQMREVLTRHGLCEEDVVCSS